MPLSSRLVATLTWALGSLALTPRISLAAEPALLDYTVAAKGIHQELSPDFCWFHPRVAAMPGQGKDGKPAVIVTLQKHLAASDHFPGCM